MTHQGAPTIPLAHRARRPRTLAGPWVTAGIVGVACVGLVLRDPHVTGSYGFCPLVATTGWSCPFCGGLRATSDLLHGDVAGAWASNPLWVVAIPLVVTLWGLWLTRSRRGEPMPSWLRSSRTVIVLAAALVLFTVLRNLPWLSGYLAPH